MMCRTCRYFDKAAVANPKFGRCTYELPLLPRWYERTHEIARFVSINTAECATFAPATPVRAPLRDNDCEDQAFAATKVCLQWKCQEWRAGAPTPWKPPLVLRGKFWCCPKCGGSYGANPHPDCPPAVPVESKF